MLCKRFHTGFFHESLQLFSVVNFKSNINLTDNSYIHLTPHEITKVQKLYVLHGTFSKYFFLLYSLWYLHDVFITFSFNII